MCSSDPCIASSRSSAAAVERGHLVAAVTGWAWAGQPLETSRLNAEALKRKSELQHKLKVASTAGEATAAAAELQKSGMLESTRDWTGVIAAMGRVRQPVVAAQLLQAMEAAAGEAGPAPDAMRIRL